MLFDLRFAARQLLRYPGLTAAAVVTLALGIGANTAIFSVIHTVLLKSLPYPEPDRLVRVFEVNAGGNLNSVAGGAYKDWREHAESFSDLAIFEPVRHNLTGDDPPANVSGLAVSANFLRTLGTDPVLGRGFRPGEDTPGGDNAVVVLSHELWQSRFGGGPEVLGSQVSLDQVAYTVVGVLAPRALVEHQASFLVPTVISDDPNLWARSGHWRHVVGRLLPGVTAERAVAELVGIKESLAASYPSFKDEWSVTALPLKEVTTRDLKPMLMLLMGTVVLVLLVACANVSNLLLARGGARRREMAIRRSLGARPARILRQVLLESLLLALVGCGAGLLVALFAVDLLADMVQSQLPQVLRPELDGGVLLFSVALACGCSLLFGLLPAWKASRSPAQPGLKESERGSVSGRQRRSQELLVAAEVALTLVLLVGAGLFLRSFVHLLQTDPGFNPHQALAFDLSFPAAKYPAGQDRLQFVDELLPRLEALPGVETAAAGSALPLSRVRRTEFASRGDEPERTDYLVRTDFVQEDYLRALETPLLRGRFLNEADARPDAPRAAVVDQGLVRDLYPHEDPLGQRLHLLGETWEIVGVAGPVRHTFLALEPQPAVYLPLARNPRVASIVLRSQVPPLSLVEAVRQEVLAVDPDQPIANVRTLEADVARSIETQRMALVLLALFAGVAVLLACVGIYGVMAFAVGQRARELSIRTVLGAQRRDVLRLVLKGGLRPSLLGMAVGLAGAALLARLAESLLYEVRTYDPLVFLLALAVLTGLAAASTLLPAHRAADADPTRALREE